MILRHVALTQKQWDETWNSIPPEMRFYPTEESRFKAGFVCFILDDMLLWVDYLLPEDQRDYEVERAIAKLKGDKPLPGGRVNECQWVWCILYSTEDECFCAAEKLKEENKRTGLPVSNIGFSSVYDPNGKIAGYVVTGQCR